jgi:hypothetical protein
MLIKFNQREYRGYVVVIDFQAESLANACCIIKVLNGADR